MTVRALLLSLALAATAAPAARAQSAAPAETAGPAPAAAPAPAETSAPAAPRVILDAILAKTHQALVYDRNHGSYVVVRAGDTLQGFVVTAVQADQLILSAGTTHYVITLPAPADDPKSAPAPAAPPAKAPTLTPIATPVTNPADQPLDPYANALPMDPYAAASPAPVSGTAPTPAPAASPAPAATPAPASAAKPAPASKPAAGPILPALELPPLAEISHQRVRIPRAEFDGALDDFTALAQEIQLARDHDRVRVIDVSRGSFPYRLGLRAGDEISSIAGAHVADLDAAAGVYAQLKSTDRFTIELLRGHRRLAIDVHLTR